MYEIFFYTCKFKSIFFIFRYKIKKLIRNRNKKCTRKLDFFNEFFTP